jgi:hypothetical protein
MTSLLVAVALALVWLLLCGMAAEYAARRGHSPLLWYLFALFCTPLLAFFIVGMLPAAADLVAAGYRRCPACGGVVGAEASLCTYCHSDLSGKPKAKKMAA